MEQKIIQLINNPQVGIARDTTVSGGSTVFVRLSSGQTVNAIAVSPINSPRVVVAFSEKDNAYYAIPESAATEISRETSELSRSRPGEVLVEELPFIVIVYNGTKYSSVEEVLPFDINNLSLLEARISYLKSQENSEILAVGSPNFAVDKTMDIFYYNNGASEVSNLTDLEVPFFVRNMAPNTELSLAKGVLNRVAIGLVAAFFDARGATYEVIKVNEGVSNVITELILPSETYTGTPVNVYTYQTQENGQTIPEDLTIVRAVSSVLTDTLVFGKLVFFQSLFGDFGRDIEYYKFNHSLDIGMIAIDDYERIGLTGHLRIQSLKQTSMDASYDINYLYTDTDPNFTYTYTSQNRSRITYEILANNTNTGDPNLSGSNYDFRATAIGDVVAEETLTSPNYVYQVSWGPNLATFPTGTYSFSYRKEFNKTLVMRRQQTYNSTGGGLAQQYNNESLTISFDVNWRGRCSYSLNVNYEENFVLGSFATPLRYKIISSASFDVTTTSNVTGTHAETLSAQAQTAMNASTASQIFAIPEGINPNTIGILQGDITVGSALFRAGDGRAFDVNSDDVSITTSVAIDNQFLRILVSNDNATLINRCSLKANIVYTRRRVLRKQFQTIAFSANVTSNSQAVLEDISFKVFDFDLDNKTLNNPWENLTGMFRLDISGLYISEAVDYSEYQVVELFPINNIQQQWVGSLSVSTNSVTNFEIVNELIFWDGTSEISLNRDNTMYARFTSSSKFTNNAGIITLEGIELYDTSGAMSPSSSIPESWSETTTNTWNGSSFESVEVGNITSSNIRKQPNEFIGEEFLVFDRINSILFTCSLSSVTVNSSDYDIDLVVLDQQQLNAKTFFDDRDNNFIVVTKENLVAMFLVNQVNSGIHRFLTISGRNIFLAYREQDELAQDELGFVHQFAIDENNNLIFVGEVQHRIFSPFPGNPKSNGDFRQLVI